MTWPAGRHPDGTEAPYPPAPAALAAGPVPVGRARWRFYLATRSYAALQWSSAVIGELTDARSRRLEQKLNSAATLTFTLPGNSAGAAQLRELEQEVIAVRWREDAGRDEPVFRGIITQSQDTITEDANTVTVTCHDHFAMLSRRVVTSPWGNNFTGTDQDNIVYQLVDQSTLHAKTGSNVPLTPGSYLPLATRQVTPAGGIRGLSGQVRDRTYLGSQQVGEAIDNLAHVINGFDYSVTVAFSPDTTDSLNLWYPYQGVLRSDPALIYGSTVSAVTRSVNSANYANYVRVLGNNATTDPAAAQKYSEAWDPNANNVTVVPVGVWMFPDNASDTATQTALDEKAQGDLAQMSVLVPTYTLGLRPGFYSWGNPNMGDVVPLVIIAGRLNVNTTVRVVGITYDIGDDGQEDVELTVGRPDVTFADLFTSADRDVDALARR